MVTEAEVQVVLRFTSGAERYAETLYLLQLITIYKQLSSATDNNL